MNKRVMIFSLAILALGLSGCTNTLDGAGRDISNVGDSIQRTF